MDESVIRHFEEQKVGKIKLSEAIRIGARLRPQCRAEFFKDGGSCVIGAALEGAGLYWKVMAYKAEKRVWPYHWIRELFPNTVSDREFFVRNDNGETREQIADWLEEQGF